jgi:hypothetical protein
VYAYPADLQETADDFSAGPAVLQGIVTLSAYQDPTVFAIDVSAVVSEALSSGVDAVAFRMQIDPDTTSDINQAFIDAVDSDPSTKPSLTIGEAPPLPGDLDGDGDVDLYDLAELMGTYGSCTGEPDYIPLADIDGSGCVDLPDLAALLGNYGTGT